jgi:hypothetical protein
MLSINDKQLRILDTLLTQNTIVERMLNENIMLLCKNIFSDIKTTNYNLILSIKNENTCSFTSSLTQNNALLLPFLKVILKESDITTGVVTLLRQKEGKKFERDGCDINPSSIVVTPNFIPKKISSSDVLILLVDLITVVGVLTRIIFS